MPKRSDHIPQLRLKRSLRPSVIWLLAGIGFVISKPMKIPTRLQHRLNSGQKVRKFHYCGGKSWEASCYVSPNGRRRYLKGSEVLHSSYKRGDRRMVGTFLCECKSVEPIELEPGKWEWRPWDQILFDAWMKTANIRAARVSMMCA